MSKEGYENCTKVYVVHCSEFYTGWKYLIYEEKVK